MNEQSRSKDALTKAVRQALYHISRSSPIPKANKMLTSPVVLQRLIQTGEPDTPDSRQAVVEEILRELVNEYGLRQIEGRRQQELHRRTFDVLFNLLQGHPRSRDLPTRTYERFHAKAIVVLADEFEKHERRVSSIGENDNPKVLQEARQRAEDGLKLLRDAQAKVDFFILADVAEAATLVESLDYPEMAKPYFEEMLECLNRLPINHIGLQRKAFRLMLVEG
jgi:hypothetical protein